LPGRLSVSRTFGDIEAKIERRGGNRNVVIAVPEIKSFRISEEHDFIVLASKLYNVYIYIIGDGIFDKINNKEAIDCVWNSVKDARSENIH
jgi:protein phosphatase 2C family protein 2/3